MAEEASIKAHLGLDVTNWRENSRSAQTEVDKFSTKVREGKAALAVFEGGLRAAGSATEEQKKKLADATAQVRVYEQSLRKAERALKDITAQEKAYAAAQESSALKAPDDSARYQAHLKRVDEQERAARASEAIKRRLANPTPAVEAAAISYGRKVQLAVERLDQSKRGGATSTSRLSSIQQDKEGNITGVGDESGEGGGSNRQRNQELGHVARSIFDQVAAGQSLFRAIEIEAPRILQAFGTSFGSLLKNLTPMTGVAAGAAVAVGALAIAISKSHAEAVKRNEDLDKYGRPDSSLGGLTVEHARERTEELTEPIKKAQAAVDSPIGNFFSNLTVKMARMGEGVNQSLANFVGSVVPFAANGAKDTFVSDPGNTRQEGLDQLKADQAGRIKRENEAQARETNLDKRAAAEGSDSIATDRLEEEYKKRQIEIFQRTANKPAAGDTEYLKNLREEIDLRKRIADAQHDQIRAQYDLAAANAKTAQGDTYGTVYDTSANSKALDISRANLEAAQKELKRRQDAGLDTREAQKQYNAASVSHYQTVNEASAAVRVAESQTGQLDEQTVGLKAAADLEALRSKYNEEIVKSQQAGTTELTEQLTKQRDLSIVEKQAAAYREANDTKAVAEGLRKRIKDEQDAQHMRDQGRTHDADRDGSVVPNAGWKGDPENAGGTAAVESLDNAPSLPNRPGFADDLYPDFDKTTPFYKSLPDDFEPVLGAGEQSGFDEGNQTFEPVEMPAPDLPGGNQANAGSGGGNSDIVAAIAGLQTYLGDICTRKV